MLKSLKPDYSWSSSPDFTFNKIPVQKLETLTTISRSEAQKYKMQDNRYIEQAEDGHLQRAVIANGFSNRREDHLNLMTGIQLEFFQSHS